MVRTFVAIELPPDVLQALSQARERLRQGDSGRAGRWVRTEGVHLTLAFLGEVPTERLQTIAMAVSRACQGVSAFSVTVGGLGCFPNTRRPRVVWMGVQDASGELAALQAAVGRELAAHGFPKEDRPFRPHLTLARVAQDADRAAVEALVRQVGEGRVGAQQDMLVSRVSLMRSDLRPEGALYTELWATELAPSAR